MKKIAFYLFWTVICLHATINFSEAADDYRADIVIKASPIVNEGFDSAPNQNIIKPLTLTPWELIHRTAMLQGFTWTGSIANFITPAMYAGTPLQTNANSLGYSQDIGPTNYTECIRFETTSSFGIDNNMIEDTVEDELRNIAKYCAIEFYGSYFEGKKYTTREEILMMLFTMFDEDIILPGTFKNSEFIFDGKATETAYSNVSSRSWSAPYIALAYDLIMIEDEGTWKTALEVKDKDIQTMIEMYLTDEDGGVSDTIETQYGTYKIYWENGTLIINKTSGIALSQNQNTTSQPIVESISKKTRYPGCDTDDIVLPNGQVWAACNVGASKAGTGVESYGSLFQWGRNVPFASTGTVKTVQGPLSYEDAMKTKDFISNTQNGSWLNTNNNDLWGGKVIDTSKSIGTVEYSSRSEDEKKSMQGPCVNGYHVPTLNDWDKITGNSDLKPVTDASKAQYILSLMKLPLTVPRFVDGTLNPKDTSSHYWASTVFVDWTSGGNINFSKDSIYPFGNGGLHAEGYSIRCLKN